MPGLANNDPVATIPANAATNNLEYLRLILNLDQDFFNQIQRESVERLLEFSTAREAVLRKMYEGSP
jgi:hypothetical protein